MELFSIRIQRTFQLVSTVVPPDKKNNNSFLKLDRTTPLELFFTNFKNQYQNPTSFSFFLVPLAVLDKTLNAVIQIRKGEDPGPDGKKLVENSELNDEGRIAKLTRQYKFDEHQLPWKDLNALGLDKGQRIFRVGKLSFKRIA